MQYSMLKQGRCPATQSSNGSQSYAGWKKQHLCQARGGRCYTTVHASSAPSGPSTPPERPKTAARAFSGAAAPMPQPSFPGFPLPGANTKPAEQTASGAAEGQPQGNTKANTDSRQQARTIDIAGTSTGSSMDTPAPHGLPLSLYHNYDKLPAEGKVAVGADKHKFSQKTLIYTYESACQACQGTGFAKPYGRARRGARMRASTCMLCHGLGYVRCTTSRFEPDAANITINRPPDQQQAKRPPTAN